MAHHDNPAHLGVRTRRYKLIYFYGQPLDAAGAVKKPTEPYWELYDLQTDAHETDNVIADPAYAQTLRELTDQLRQLQEDVGDSMPEDYSPPQ